MLPDTLLAYYIHQLSPYIWRFTDKIGLHWYGFAYVMAFVCGYWLYHWLARRGYSELPPAKVGDFITYAAIFGVMLGGRLGWIIFYGWDDVRANPLRALKLWEGGMSSHGGILGLVIFTFAYARMHKVSWPGIGDNLVVVAPIGLFFGRCANFINGELWGRITKVPWAMQFPKEFAGDTRYAELVDRAYAHDPVALQVLAGQLPPRHPSQLYEAFLEGIVLFSILWLIRTRTRAPVGVLTGVFFLGYAVLRIIGEEFREPDVGIAFTLGLTRGQFLSLFMLLIGAAFCLYGWRTRRVIAPPVQAASSPPPEPAAAP
jgi:phosphatidylglycerol:prolipoprotein diacylglycerol transferase